MVFSDLILVALKLQMVVVNPPYDLLICSDLIRVGLKLQMVVLRPLYEFVLTSFVSV